MSLTNETWLMQLAGGGPEQQTALSQLREALIRNLHAALASHAAVNDAFIEDTVQDALIRILERLGQFEGRSQFLTWATSIAIRVAMSELRRHRWKDVSLDEVASKLRFTRLTTVESTDQIVCEQPAIVTTMYEIIERDLTEKQRAVLLGELRGVPQNEIVRHLGSNRNAVYKLGHDARRRLKQGLEEAGFHADDVHAAFAV